MQELMLSSGSALGGSGASMVWRGHVWRVASGVLVNGLDSLRLAGGALASGVLVHVV